MVAVAAGFFGWEYPAGSMRGSGIYSEVWDGQRYCGRCDADADGTYEADDWGRTTWRCDTHPDEVEDIGTDEFGPDEEPDD